MAHGGGHIVRREPSLQSWPGWLLRVSAGHPIGVVERTRRIGLTRGHPGCTLGVALGLHSGAGGWQRPGSHPRDSRVADPRAWESSEWCSDRGWRRMLLLSDGVEPDDGIEQQCPARAAGAALRIAVGRAALSEMRPHHGLVRSNSTGQLAAGK